ncbi:MAG: hypothetical protein ACM3JG_13380 [Thiohalocapsa sp.]
MRGVDDRREPAAEWPDGSLWRRSRGIDARDEEAARYLDLAAFADGELDPDERERIAERLALDPEAATDVAAARDLAAGAPGLAAPAAVVARACALVRPGERPGDDAAAGVVVPLRARPRSPSGVRGAVGWAGLAAAAAMVAWIGFTLGMDTSLTVGQRSPGDGGFLQELLNPTSGLLPDLNAGQPT